MTVKRAIKGILPRLLPGLILLASVSGCIKEDRDDCAVEYYLTARAYDTETSSTPAGSGQRIHLFIFDEQERFLHTVETVEGERTVISERANRDLTIVGWANLREGDQSWTEPQPGQPLAECFVSLVPDTRAAAPMLAPGDLFRGRILMEASDLRREREIPLYRQVGSMTVTIRGLKEVAGWTDGYRIKVRETPSRISFADGTLSGAAAFYRPSGAFVAAPTGEQYVVQAFNLLPGAPLHIDIYHGSTLVETVSTDSGGSPIEVVRGRQTNVLIDLRTLLSVTVSLTNWGENAVWKEF